MGNEIKNQEVAKEVTVTPAKEVKHYETLYDRVKKRLNTTRFIFSLVSMIFYTLFTIIMLWRNWGSTVYSSIVLGFVVLYVLIFAGYLVFTRRSKKINRNMKDYKSGLKIMKSLLSIINFGLSISVFTQVAVSSDDITSKAFQITVLIVSLAWALFQLVYQISRILKRHELLKKKKKR